MKKHISLTQYLVEVQRSKGLIPGELRLLLEVVARACKRISRPWARARSPTAWAMWAPRTSRVKSR